MSYKLKLEVFEGPLDLLLYLIKKDEVNIYDIPIAEITEQYLAYIEMLKMLDLETIGEFLVMAATLMQIKSRMLLPPDPSETADEEIDPRDELVERLLEYKKFKEAAAVLQEKEALRRNLFSRVVDAEVLGELKEDSREIYFEASLFDLITAFRKVLESVPREVFYQVIKDEFTVEQKIHDILHLLLDVPHLSLLALFQKARTRVEAVVTFMSILELIRLKEIIIVQKGLFGDIEILRNKDNMLPQEPQEPGA